MTDLALTNKPKYGTGQFKTDSLSPVKTALPKSLTTFDKYTNNIKPILGNDTKGIFKRFANSISFDSAYPTKLKESQRQGVAHKVRELIGGDNTIKNQADIEAYNTKPLFFNKSYTHGDVSSVSEVGTVVLGTLAGGAGIIKLIGNIPKLSWSYSKAALGYESSFNLFKKGPWTKAGRSLTKHPNIVGVKVKDSSMVTKALIDKYGSTKEVNQAGANALKYIIDNGSASIKSKKAYGDVLDYKLPNGLGARFNITTNEFIGFLGRGLK